jgi:cytochrome c553
MKTLLRFVGMLALAVAVLAVAVAFWVYSGAYDVSASKGHTKLVGSTLNALMVRSVRAHARDIVSPVGMDFHNPALLEKAAGHFDAMCRTCHGAPGRKPDPWELYPPAPDLADALRDRPWNDAEAFWIIKHGLKDTAMSAFGGSHSDDDIWGLVALIRQFSSMTPEQYHAMVEQHAAKGEAHEPGAPAQPESAPAAESGHTHKH